MLKNKDSDQLMTPRNRNKIEYKFKVRNVCMSNLKVFHMSSNKFISLLNTHRLLNYLSSCKRFVLYKRSTMFRDRAPALSAYIGSTAVKYMNPRGAIKLTF